MWSTAPSKLQRPSGDRVKTDAEDASSTSLVCCGWARSPRWACRRSSRRRARDLVRAREDCRGDLMRARHRLSKLLLRQGIVYSGGRAWTGAHDAWLRRQRFTSAAVRMTFESDYEAVLTVQARRQRLDTAIAAMAAESEFTPVVHRLGCLRAGLDPDRVRARGRDRRTGAGPPARRSARSSVWCPASTPPAARGSRARSPRPATPMCAGCWSRPPAPPCPLRRGQTLRDRSELAAPTARARGDAGDRGCTTDGSPSPTASDRVIAASPSPAAGRLVLVPGRDEEVTPGRPRRAPEVARRERPRKKL